MQNILLHNQPARQLKSSSIHQFQRPAVTSTFAARAFSVSVRFVCNSFTLDLHSINTLGSFKSMPKTTLFLVAYSDDMPGNLCHCRQATSAVRWHWVTVRTKDKDHAGDEEFRGRRSSYLEQFASRPANHNSLPVDVRSTSEGSPVRLIDSAPEDYLGRALQIYSSSWTHSLADSTKKTIPS